MFNAFFRARPRLRAILFGLAVCLPSFAVGVSAALAQTSAVAVRNDRLSVMPRHPAWRILALTHRMAT